MKMKKQFFVFFLIVSSVMGNILSMENPTEQWSQESFFTIATHELQSRQKDKHLQNISSCIEDGSPENLDTNLMKIAFNSLPAKLKARVYGLKNSTKKQLYSRLFLLAGPPGTGKTTGAYSIAHELGLDYRFIEVVQLADEYKDSGHQNLWRALIPILQGDKPKAIILDEVTAITRDHIQEKTDGYKTAESLRGILDKHKQCKNGSIIVCTTNNPEEMPDKLKNRFSLHSYNITAPLNNTVLSYYLGEFDAVCDAQTFENFVAQTKDVPARELEDMVKAVLQLAEEKAQNQVVLPSYITEVLEEWRYNNEEILKSHEQQLTLQERLHKESIDFQKQEGETTRAQQKQFNDQQVVMQTKNAYWNIYNSGPSSCSNCMSRKPTYGFQMDTARQYENQMKTYCLTPDQLEMYPLAKNK